MKIENELGVIVSFSAQAERYGFSIISINSEFPDAVVKYGGKAYRVEFEYQSKNFKTHAHDVRKCDLIICYEHNWSNCILPVIALSNKDWHNTNLTLPTDQEREIAYWKLRAFRVEGKLKKTQNQLAELSLMNYNKKDIGKDVVPENLPKWLPRWPKDKTDFLAMVESGELSVDNITSKVLHETGVVGTERTGYNWLNEARNNHKENGHG